MQPLDVLVLEPWLGGSHERFLRQWQERSEHTVEILGLPARHWKWRMRDGARELAARIAERRIPDVLCATSYVDLPCFFGFAPPSWASVPSIYFLHENQLTYPLAPGVTEAERDRHFGYTNILSCLRATHVSFNSRYHRDDFAAAADKFLAALPDRAPRPALARCMDVADVVAPGIEFDRIPIGAGPGSDHPLRIAFNHRWEHDKDPAAFLRAVVTAGHAGLFDEGLELTLLGERYDKLPDGVEALLNELAPYIVVDGFQPSFEAYINEIGHCDVVVSTATHEFFGIAIAEALAAGCTPLVPNRLAYPELVDELSSAQPYRDEEELLERLLKASRERNEIRSSEARGRIRETARRYDAGRVALELDASCARLALQA